MFESRRSDEAEIGQQIRSLAAVATAPRDPHEVLDTVLARKRHRWRLPAVAAASLGIVVVIAAGTGVVLIAAMTSRQSGSGPAVAEVNGLTYTIGIVRSIDLDRTELRPYGEAALDDEFATQGATAFQIDGLAPERVLVMILVPGQEDDSGPIGDYLVLVRGDAGWKLLCPFFQPRDPLVPTVCQ
jgi:hypothetical protein